MTAGIDYTVDGTADSASVAVEDDDASTDATLSGLSVSDGILDPAFDSTTTAYTVALANSVGTVTVTPTATDSGATITVNGASVPAAATAPILSWRSTRRWTLTLSSPPKTPPPR